MRNLRVLVIGMAILALGACAPRVDTVTPSRTQEMVSAYPYAEAFALVVSVINTQPFPSDASGWLLTTVDQAGGFVGAELTGSRRASFGRTVAYRAFISVSLTDRGNGTTSVNLSFDTHEESISLAEAIRQRLGL